MSKDISIPDQWNYQQRTPEQYKLEVANIANLCKSANIWPHCPSLLCAETTTKINAFCVHCRFVSKRDWHGWILGKGMYGSINALFLRSKHKETLLRKKEPLMALYTLCLKCCDELELYDEDDQMDIIRSFKDKTILSASMIVGAIHKDLEEILISRLIIMDGKFTSSFKTVTMDGKGSAFDVA